MCIKVITTNVYLPQAKRIVCSQTDTTKASSQEGVSQFCLKGQYRLSPMMRWWLVSPKETTVLTGCFFELSFMRTHFKDTVLSAEKQYMCSERNVSPCYNLSPKAPNKCWQKQGGQERDLSQGIFLFTVAIWDTCRRFASQAPP